MTNACKLAATALNCLSVGPVGLPEPQVQFAVRIRYLNPWVACRLGGRALEGAEIALPRGTHATCHPKYVPEPACMSPGAACCPPGVPTARGAFGGDGPASTTACGSSWRAPVRRPGRLVPACGCARGHCNRSEQCTLDVGCALQLDSPHAPIEAVVLRHPRRPR